MAKKAIRLQQQWQQQVFDTDSHALTYTYTLIDTHTPTATGNENTVAYFQAQLF